MLKGGSFPDLGPFKDTQVSQVSPLSTVSWDEEGSCLPTERETTWLEEALNTPLGSSHLRHRAQQFLDCQCVPLRKWADILRQPSSPVTAATAHSPALHTELSEERTWNNASLRSPSGLKWINWAQQLTHTPCNYDLKRLSGIFLIRSTSSFMSLCSPLVLRAKLIGSKHQGMQCSTWGKTFKLD